MVAIETRDGEERIFEREMKKGVEDNERTKGIKEGGRSNEIVD